MLPYELFAYDEDLYPFRSTISELLAEPDLTALRDEGPMWSREQDQSSIWHAKYYSLVSTWRPLYHQFVREVIATRFGEPFYYQRVPTLRVHLPNNKAVGTFHSDLEFGHPAGEINFWVPLTPAFGTNSCLVQDRDDRLFMHSINASPGQVATFDHIGLRHGNLLNRTKQARVSFDFRCLPLSRLPATLTLSVNTNVPMAPGGYYELEPVCPS